MGIKLVVVLESPEQPTGEIEPVDQEGITSYLSSTGQLRQLVEKQFARGIPASYFHSRYIPVVSGNFLTARPRGVVNGTDFGFAGVIRKVRQSAILELLTNDVIVMQVPVGYSSTGQAYALARYEVAAEIAVSVGASKLITMSGEGLIAGHSNLTTPQARSLIEAGDLSEEAVSLLELFLNVSQRGVARCHSIPYAVEGSLIQELFTADGIGTQLTDLDYRGIRHATSDDIGGIAELISPFVNEGLIVPRAQTMLAEEPERFLIAEHEGVLTGCVAVYDLSDEAVEVGSMVISYQHRNQRIGRELVYAAEAEARRRGAKVIFGLTTQAIDFLLDLGYQQIPLSELPNAMRQRQATKRKSVLVRKNLT